MKKGFTVIELLVVLAIIGIILSITIPRLQRSGEGAKLKTSVDIIVSLLETAKSYAAAQHVNVSVTYMPGTRALRLERTDTDDQDHDGDTDENIVIDRPIVLPQSVSASFTADNTVTFNPWGGVVNPDDAITVTTATLKKTRTITIDNMTGYIQY